MLRTLVEDQEIDAAEDFDLSVYVSVSDQRALDFGQAVKQKVVMLDLGKQAS